MVHRRTPYGTVKQYAYDQSFYAQDDYRETIYIGETDPDDLYQLLTFLYEDFVQPCWYALEQGEVLKNPDGTGSMQLQVGAFQL